MRMIVALLCALLCATAGCSFLAPGADTRMAANAKSITTWDQNSNLSLQEDTTHNRRVVAAEGEAVELDYYKDGTPLKVKGASQVLSQWSEPKDVMDAYMRLAEKNAEVAGHMFQAMERLAALYQPILMERQIQQGYAASRPAERPLADNILDLIREELARNRAQPGQ